jgi:hypothetical protein
MHDAVQMINSRTISLFQLAILLAISGSFILDISFLDIKRLTPGIFINFKYSLTAIKAIVDQTHIIIVAPIISNIDLSIE